MSVEVWPVSGSTLPFGVEEVRVEEVLRQADAGAVLVDVGDVQAVVALALDPAAQQAVAEAERHGGELGGDAGIDVRVVAGVRRQGVRPEQVGQIFVVDDALILGDVDLARLLVELLVAPAGVCLLQLRRR